MSRDQLITLARAREVLGVQPLATADQVRRAYREAAKNAHPDRVGGGGGGDQFREVVDAYNRLSYAPVAEGTSAPVSAPIEPGGMLVISPMVALLGGSATHRLVDGRRIRVRLPAGLRTRDTVRAGGAELLVAVTPDAGMQVRGNDLWVSVTVDPRTMIEGGRVALETPLGRRIVWVTRKAGERGLVRIVGQGLPARGRHAQGHLFVRLSATSGQSDSAASALLRRFTAAWAA